MNPMTEHHPTLLPSPTCVRAWRLPGDALALIHAASGPIAALGATDVAPLLSYPPCSPPTRRYSTG